MEYLLKLKLGHLFCCYWNWDICFVIGIGALVLFKLELWMHWKCVCEWLAECMAYIHYLSFGSCRVYWTCWQIVALPKVPMRGQMLTTHATPWTLPGVEDS